MSTLLICNLLEIAVEPNTSGFESDLHQQAAERAHAVVILSEAKDLQFRSEMT